MGTRSANRAAKRAATGPVRPKTGVRKGSRRRSNNGPLIAVAAGAAVLAVAVLLFANPFGGPGASPTPPTVRGDGTCPTSQPASLTAADVKTVTITTSKGTIVMRIDGASAPIATGNFVALATCKYYDGVVFHRLVPGFVIQGGDPEGTGQGGPGYEIEDDPLNGQTYHRGTVAMARTAQPDSQGSQFFIVLADSANTALLSAQYPYAIMGEVTSGMDVVDAIAAMPNSGDGGGNAAIDPVAMISVVVTDGPPPTAAPTAAPTATAVPSVAPTVAPSATTQ